MRSRALAKVAVLLGLWLFGSLEVYAAADCVAGVVARLGRAAPADADTVLRFAASIEDGSPAGKGLFAALEARRGAGDEAARVREILFYFPGDASRGVFEQLSRVAHVGEEGGLGKFVVNLGKSQNDAIGAAAVLRFATTQMDPARVARFEVDVAGRVVDLVDDAGNLLEFKSLQLDGYAEFLARIEFEKIRDQAQIFQQAAAAQGTTLSLVFEYPVPQNLRAAFDEILGPLLGMGNVRFVDGF